MKKQLSARRLLSLVLSIVMLFAMCITTPFVTSAESENSVTTVKFDYGDSESFNDFATVSVENGKAALPGNMPNSSKSYRTDYPVGNISGWTDGNTIFSNDVEIDVSKISVSAVSDGTAILTAVYGEAVANYDDLADSNGFYSLGLGTGEAKISSNAVEFAHSVWETRIFAPVIKSEDTYATMYYNKNTRYRISFKYKTDSTLTVGAAFGVITNTVTGVGHVGGKACVSNEEIVTTSNTGDKWVTVEKEVISPSTYGFNYDANNYSARSIGISLDGSARGTIYFDDIKIEPLDSVKCAVFDYEYEKKSIEISGNSIEFPSDGSVNLKWENSGNIYNPGDIVDISNLKADDSGNYPFEASYQETTIGYDYNIGANNDFKFFGSGFNYGTGAAVIKAGTKYVTVTNRINYGQAVLLSRSEEGVDSFVKYNAGKGYKVKLKYKSTVNTKFYVAFGVATDTSCGNTCNYKQSFATAEKSSEWTEITGYVTAPADLSYSNRRVGIGFEQSANGTTEYDDITITPVKTSKIIVDYGNSDAIGDGYDLSCAENFTFPSAAPDSCMNEMQWENGGKIYKAGTQINVDELSANSDGTYTITAVYGRAESNFASLPANTAFGTGAAKGVVAVDDDNKYVKFEANTADGRQILIMGKEGDNYKYINYTPGKKYTAFITYRVNAIDQGKTLRLGVGYGPYFNDQYTPNQTQNNATTDIQPIAIIDGVTDGFVTKAATFTAYSEYNSENKIGSRRMTLAFEGTNSAKFDVLSLIVIPEEESSTVRFEMGYGTLKSTPFIVEPESIELPAKPDDCANEFLWKNGDKTFEPGTTVSTIGSGLTREENGSYVFTAMFGKATADFSTFPDNHAFKTGAAKLAKDSNGNNILKVNVNTPPSESRQVPLFNYENGKRLNINYTPGREYVASITAKVNTLNTKDGILNLGIGFSPYDPYMSTGDSWMSANPSYNFTDTIANIAKIAEVTDEYVTYTGVFTAPENAGNGNVLTTLTFGGVNENSTEFEVSNVTITPAEECTVITLHYNRGIEETKRISVPADAAFTLPEPTLSGYKFAGWYTDSTCITSVADPYIPADGDELWADYIPDGAIGDVNADGTVDIRDLVRLKNTAAGNGTANDVIRADINHDGANSFVDDIVLLRKILLGIKDDVDIVGSYIAGIPVEKFSIIMNGSSFADVNTAAGMLSGTLGKSIVPDSTKETEFEILIGSTNRAESSEGLNSGCEVYVTDKKLVINAADDASLAQAILLVNRYFKHATDKKMALILNHGFKKKI